MGTWLVILLLSALVMLLSCSSSEAYTIHVGLMFPLTTLRAIDIDDPNPLALRVVNANSYIINLASTIAAINMINSNAADILQFFTKEIQPRTSCSLNIQYTVMDTVSDFAVALSQYEKQKSLGKNFDIIIGPFLSRVSVPVSFVTGVQKIPILSPAATATELDDKRTHKYFGRTLPSDAAVADAILGLLDALPKAGPYKYVNILYTEDVYGRAFKDALFEESQPRKIELRLTPIKYQSKQSIKDAVSRAVTEKLNVFIAIVFLQDLKDLMLEAESQGLTGAGKLWIYTDSVASANDIVQLISSCEDPSEKLRLVKSLNGTMQVVIDADTENDNYRAFKQAFDDRDGYDYDELKRALPGGANNQIEADDLSPPPNFNNLINDDFFEANSNFSQFSLFAYDAILATAKVFNNLLPNDCNGPLVERITGDEVIREMKSANFSFQGTSGEVRFDTETASRRRSTSLIRASNFIFTDGLEARDITVGIYRPGTKWQLSNSIVYPGSVVNEAPAFTDAPDVQRNEVSPTFKTASDFFVYLTIVVAIILILWVVDYWRTPVLRAAQPVFLVFILFGIIISSCSVLYFYRDELKYTKEENDLRCNVSNMLVSLGITLTQTALFIKLRRIILLARPQETFRKKKVSLWWAIKRILLSLSFNGTIILFVYMYNPLSYELTVIDADEFEQPTSLYYSCQAKNGNMGFVYVLWFFFHILLYMYGGYLVWAARKLSSDFQEGRAISISVLTTIQLSVLGIPVVVAIGPSERSVQLFVISLVICLSNLLQMGLIFGPRIWKVVTGRNEVNWTEPDHFVRPSGELTLRKDSKKILKTVVESSEF